MTKIDWISKFKDMSIGEPFKPEVYLTTTDKQKENYFSDAAYNLTLQYLYKFKEETWLLRTQRKIDFINSLNIKKPKSLKSKSSLLNQTGFEAQSNFYEFINDYKKHLINLRITEDKRYLLTEYFNENIRKNSRYKALLSEIQRNGCCHFIYERVKMKVYTPELMLIFSSNEFEVKDLEINVEVKINGKEYLNDYFEGYRNGIDFFKENFSIPPSALYGLNAEQFVKDIHVNYFHTNHMLGHHGWQFVKYNYPTILTHEAVNQWGFYSGIINEVDEMVKKYPNVFKTFDKCEHKLDYENWLNGNFTLKSELIKELETGTFNKILNQSQLLIKEHAVKERDRLILNFERRLNISDNPKLTLIKEIKYYNSLLSHEIKDIDKGYLKPVTFYSDCIQYDCQFVKKVQSKRANYDSGRVNDYVRNPIVETFDYSGDENVFCTVTAIAWVKYLESLNEKKKAFIGKISENSSINKKSINEELNYNSNYWNENCFKLFTYLTNEYKKEGNVKYINIYYFLKQMARDHNHKYRFKMRIEKDYKPFIKNEFTINITKFEKAQYLYDETELPLLKELEGKFVKMI